MVDLLVLACVCFAIALVISAAVLRRWIASPTSLPSERSLHVSPIPRGGGLGVAAAVLFGLVWQGAPHALVAALFIVWAISAWDDWLGASPTLRLAIHVLAALSVVLWWTPQSSLIDAVFAVFMLVWALNLFNFMDGSDGLAASTAIIGGLSLAGLAEIAPASASSSMLASIGVIVAVAALGFLCFNLPPARIFMGDGGSTVLGFTLATACLKGSADGVWSLAAAAALFMPFWADATYTLVRRVAARHSPFSPHRQHLYQRLALAGLGHRGVLFWMIGWNLLSVIVAYLLRDVQAQAGLAFAGAYAAFYIAFTEWTLRKQPNLLMNPRAILALLYDVSAAAIAWALLFWARFNFNIDASEFTARDVARSLAFVVPVHAAVFVGMGLYQGLWRFASMADLRRIVLGAFIAAAGTAVLFALVRPDSFIRPRSVLLLQPALLILLMGGARFAYRSWREHRLYGLAAAKGEPVLVLGAGGASRVGK